MDPPAAEPRRADPWLQQSIPVLRTAPPGPILDLACGAGRNSVLLGRLGMRVFGVDASPERVEAARRAARGLGSLAAFAVREVDAEHFPPGPWAGICVFHFLDRGLFPSLAGQLLPGGVLVYKTHLAHRLRSPSQRPRRPAFLLHPGELLAAVPGLIPLRYSEWAEQGAAYAGLVARRRYAS